MRHGTVAGADVHADRSQSYAYAESYTDSESDAYAYSDTNAYAKSNRNPESYAESLRH
jgi:hypothetical protein